MNPVAKPRIGIIGFQMGANHAETMANYDIAQFVAAVDLNPDARARVELLGGAHYTDYRTMLEQEALDGVIIALPHHLHAPVAEQVAARGCHLFIEKPLAHTREDCIRIIRATQVHRVRAMVGYSRRFSGGVQKARELIRNGSIGRLVGVTIAEGGLKDDSYFSAEWKASRECGGGPLFMNTCHTIDLVRFIAGDITRVSAQITNHFRGHQVEDTAAVSLAFENGAIGTLFISDAAVGLPGSGPEFRGTEASFTLNPLTLYAYHWPWNPRAQMGLSTKPIKIQTESVNTAVAVLQRFCDVIAGDAEPLTSLEDALKTTAVIEAVIASSERGEAVDVNTIDDHFASA